MAEIYILTSDGVPLAQFENEESDMWYLMGKISPIQSSLVTLNEIFQATQDLDFKAVMCDWSQGYRCELKAEVNIIPCVLMECNPQQAILRMLTARDLNSSQKHLDSSILGCQYSSLLLRGCCFRGYQIQ